MLPGHFQSRTRQQALPITQPPRSTGPWPACSRVEVMLSPNPSLGVGMMPIIRPVDPATRDHERQRRTQARAQRWCRRPGLYPPQTSPPANVRGPRPGTPGNNAAWATACDRCGAFVPDNDYRSQIAMHDSSKPRIALFHRPQGLCTLCVRPFTIQPGSSRISADPGPAADQGRWRR